MELSAQRYCDVPFPEYRFIPGENPHPTSDPQGHSYKAEGVPEPVVQVQPAQRWRECVDYLYGCDLYNHGYWWEAHEAWEGLWHLTDRSGVQRRFLQGLIQVAARHLKLRMHKLGGVSSLGKSSTKHIQAVMAQMPAELYMGLKLRGWFAQVDAYYDTIMARDPRSPQHDVCCYPYIELGD